MFLTTVRIILISTALAQPQITPNTGAESPGGADPRVNSGSTVTDPTSTTAPSAQRNPTGFKPDRKDNPRHNRDHDQIGGDEDGMIESELDGRPTSTSNQRQPERGDGQSNKARR